MNKKNYRDVWLIIVTVCTITFSFAETSTARNSIFQDRQITGTVISIDGEKMPGVNVLIKGTSSGTVTDKNGQYTITAPGNDLILVFSFIGYLQQEIVVGNETQINVTLEPSIETLSEIVV